MRCIQLCKACHGKLEYKFSVKRTNVLKKTLNYVKSVFYFIYTVYRKIWDI